MSFSHVDAMIKLGLKFIFDDDDRAKHYKQWSKSQKYTQKHGTQKPLKLAAEWTYKQILMHSGRLVRVRGERVETVCSRSKFKLLYKSVIQEDTDW